MMKPTAIFLLPMLLLLAGITPLPAQNRIVPAPDAVELRKVWEKKGRDLRVDEYGTAMWGGIDISGDGVADFAVYQAKGEYPNTWHFYRGGGTPDTAAFWRFDSVGSPIAFGNFYGDDSLHVLFRDGRLEIIDDFGYFYDRLRVYRLSDSGVAGPPRHSVYQGDEKPPVSRTIRHISASDVNNDGVSDVSVVMSGMRVGHDRFSYDERGQIWIYLGGPDFQIDSPSVIIYDTLVDGTTPGPDWSVELSDIDGDGKIDMLSNGGFPGFLTRLRWGDENSPHSWMQRPPDRDLRRDNPEIGLRATASTPHYQIDADPAADFVGVIANPDRTATAYIYLSSQESPRTRSFTFEDADSLFLLPERFSYSEPTGYLNDSLRRTEMLPFERAEFFSDPGGLIFLSGGQHGPDADYEATLTPSRLGQALGDVTGDGWGDYGAFDPHDGIRSTGIAVVYAGGPYIPLDDPTLTVREEPVAGEPGGLFLWPNPVVDELHIAWRGDLRRMPARFEVYDAGGRLVVSGEVDPGRGKALWQCAGVPAGHYTVVGYDRSGRQIAVAPVIVR